MKSFLNNSFQYFILIAGILMLGCLSACDEKEHENATVPSGPEQENNHVKILAGESLNGWDEGYLFNDSLYYVIKTMTIGDVVSVYDSDSTYYSDSLTIEKYACINKVGNDNSKAIGIAYDSSDKVSFIRIGSKQYSFNYYSSEDSVDVICYDQINNKYIVSTYLTGNTPWANVPRNNHLMRIVRGGASSNIGNAISAINLTGDVAAGDWGKTIGDLLSGGITSVTGKALGFEVWPYIELFNWFKGPYDQMKDFIFGKSSIVITTVDEKNSVIRGKILNSETIPDVDWEFGNESVPEKYRKYGQRNIVLYGVDVIKNNTVNMYSLGPNEANHLTEWSFNIQKMTHGYYLFKTYLKGSGFTKTGNSMGYYCLGDPPTYSHSNEKAEYDSQSEDYKVSFNIQYTPLKYEELYYHQGLIIETVNGTRVASIDYKTPSMDISKHLSKSEFKDNTLELKVKYWYYTPLYSNKTQYVDLGSFTIKAKGNLSCPDDHHPHMIDLGLPSGTKWACCNVGASTPEGYGDYYAWGETEEKSYYDWSTYTHCNGSRDTCHDLGSDIAGTGYDVAHVRWGGSWVMPSHEQQVELLNFCTTQWTTKNGVNGRTFTGPSGGTIFLPAAGSRWADGLDSVGSSGIYWSSSQNPSVSYNNYGLYFRSGGAYWGYCGRRYGQSVRPVSR